MLVILIVTVLFYYKPMTIEKKLPGGEDVKSSLAQVHQYITYQKENNEEVLWNPQIFAGVPIYFRLPGTSLHLDNILNFFGDIAFGWLYYWILLAAIGMFLLLRSLGFEWYISSLGALLFIFWPHLQGLIESGHFTKIRAICAMPMVVFTYLNYLKKRDGISLLVFILFFSLQLRTLHYQVVFYTLAPLVVLGILFFTRWLKERALKRILLVSLALLASFLITALIAARPLFLTNEYTQYSTRSGDDIQMAEGEMNKEKSFKYATEWSFPPEEMLSFMIPRFYGGTSKELYDGRKFDYIRNQRIPTYWGKMLFLEASDYVGLFVIIFFFYGLWVFRKNGMVLSWAVIALLALLLSLGKYFGLWYKIFYQFIPYFSKFRAPNMALILFNFSVLITAMYGIQALFSARSAANLKPLYFIIGLVAVVSLFFLLFPEVLPFEKSTDSLNAANAETLQKLKIIRQEFLNWDILRLLLLTALLLGVLVLFVKHLLPMPIIIGFVLFLVAFDTISICQRYRKPMRFISEKEIEKTIFSKYEFNDVLQNADFHFRILETGNNFYSNALAFRYQILGGYSAIKPQLIQNIFDYNLMHTKDSAFQLNFDILNMFNVKYVISNSKISHENFRYIAMDKQRNKYLYFNRWALPRAYFVRETKYFEDERNIIAFMNTSEFDPSTQALLHEPLFMNKRYSMKAKVKIVKYTPNCIVLKTAAPDVAFMVLSEAYYPKGWTCYIDNDETQILQVNHALRGVEIPEGDHLVKFRFLPDSFIRAEFISSISLYSVYLLLVIAWVLKNKKTKILKIE